MSILVVDDNEDDRRVLRYLVERNGREAIEAENGLDALHKAQEHPPDLIISDVLMPTMDGFQFLRAVKQDAALREIPFVFYSSSYREDMDVRLAMSLGADAYVIKPLEPVKLWGTIENLLGGRREAKTQAAQLVEEEAEYLKRYSEVVATKLEEKVRELERTLEEQRRAEVRLYNLNRKLRAISSCNQAVLRATDETALLHETCRIVCDEAGYHMAWVGYPENDDAKTVRPVAWAGKEDGYLAIANITWADTERGRGPTGIAIRSGESVCIQDFATDPQAALWRENALRRGYRSSIAMPLKDDKGVVFGAFMIYSVAPNTFTPDEIGLLEELACDLAFGITALRHRIARQRAEEQMAQQFGELQRWHDVTLNREERVQELKLEVNQLLARLGEPPRYGGQV